MGTDSGLCWLFFRVTYLPFIGQTVFNLSCMCNKLNLFSVNYKVLTYLRSPNWDTRIAAGQAVEAIVKNIPGWDPAPKPKEGESFGWFITIIKFCQIMRHTCHIKHCICNKTYDQCVSCVCCFTWQLTDVTGNLGICLVAKNI